MNKFIMLLVLQCNLLMAQNNVFDTDSLNNKISSLGWVLDETAFDNQVSSFLNEKNICKNDTIQSFRFLNKGKKYVYYSARFQSKKDAIKFRKCLDSLILMPDLKLKFYKIIKGYGVVNEQVVFITHTYNNDLKIVISSFLKENKFRTRRKGLK